MTEQDGKCDRCGGKAVFEGNGEGELCNSCTRWVCNNCIDYAHMRDLGLTDEFICKDCSIEEEYEVA